MKKKFSLFSLAAAAALLTAAPVAQAKSYTAVTEPSLVTPGDTFSFDILGYNTASGSGYFVTTGIATFGVTSTYTGVDGNIVTVSSNETITGTTTTDSFSFSTPTNFYAETTLNGLTITGLELDLGNANSGSANGLAAGNTVDLLTPIATSTATGTTTYNTSTKQTLTPGTTLSNNNLSYAGVEGIQAGTSAINQFTVHVFTYSISYTNVPEPSTYAFVGAGALALGLLTVRRNLRKAAV